MTDENPQSVDSPVEREIREPEVISVPKPHLDWEGEGPPPEVRPTGRTVTNVIREGRSIT